MLHDHQFGYELLARHLVFIMAESSWKEFWLDWIALALGWARCGIGRCLRAKEILSSFVRYVYSLGFEPTCTDQSAINILGSISNMPMVHMVHLRFVCEAFVKRNHKWAHIIVGWMCQSPHENSYVSAEQAVTNRWALQVTHIIAH